MLVRQGSGVGGGSGGGSGGYGSGDREVIQAAADAACKHARDYGCRQHARLQALRVLGLLAYMLPILICCGRIVCYMMYLSTL